MPPRVLAALALAPLASPLPAAVVINEIHYHPAALAELEFVELTNAGGPVVNVGNWRFADGIAYTLPAGASLASGEYLVVARDPIALEAHFGLSGVFGPYSGRLDNAGERIELQRADATVADAMTYGDDAPWPPEADGAGQSLERINPAIDGTFALAWRASQPPGGEGTPGARNSAFTAEPPPLAAGLTHSPAVPTPSDAIAFTVLATGLSPVTVTLRWRLDSETEFQSLPMAEAGGLFGAGIPPQVQGAVVEFHVLVQDQEGRQSLFPPTAPVDNCLVQVDGTSPPPALPVYRVVMTQRDLTTLRTRPYTSNVLLNATLIAEGEIHHGCGIRYRGTSARFTEPRSYRIEMPSGDLLLDRIQEVNLNARRPDRQALALDLFARAGVPAAEHRLCRFVLRGEPALPYVRVESYDDTGIERLYGPVGEDSGTLYRGVSSADLTYRGHSFPAFYWSYQQETNEEIADKADLMDLSRDLNLPPSGELPPDALAAIDLDEWLSFFAVSAMMHNDESGLFLDRGDDYFLYLLPSARGAHLLPWDLESTFDTVHGSVLRPSLGALQRVLRSPETTRHYQRRVLDMLAGEFSPAMMDERITALLASWLEPGQVDALRRYVRHRRADIESQFVPFVTVGLDPGGGDIAPLGSLWRYHHGPTAPPGTLTAWLSPEYDDSAWAIGPSGFGFDTPLAATDVSAMKGVTPSLYLRRTFSLTNPDEIADLELTVETPAAFIVWLNGTEILRDFVNNPSQHPPPNATANTPRPMPLPRTLDLTLHRDLLRGGTNVVAIQVCNFRSDQSPFYVLPSIQARHRSPVMWLVPAGAQWSTWKGRTPPADLSPELGLDWRHRNFREGWTLWPQMTMPVGFGGIGEVTSLSDMPGQYTTLLLRHHFMISNPWSLDHLTLRIDWSDGFVATINGVEVARRGIGMDPGEPPGRDAVAATSRTPGVPEEIDLSHHLGAIRPGHNVICVLAASSGLSDEQFLVSPSLWVETLPDTGVLVQASPEVLITGRAPMPATSSVTVNGVSAEFTPWSGRWRLPASLAAGVNPLSVTAWDASGQAVSHARTRLVWEPELPPAVTGTLSSDTSWRADEGPVHVTGTLTVPQGVDLRIEPGVIVAMGAGAAIDIQGTLTAAGSPEAMITILPAVPGQRWAQLRFGQAGAPLGEPSLLAWCDISWGQGTGTVPPMIKAWSTRLTIDHCRLRWARNEAFHLRGVSTIRQSLIAHSFESVASATAAVEGNVFYNFGIGGLPGYGDMLDSGFFSPDETLLVQGNLFVDGNDDGIDNDFVGTGAAPQAVIRDNVIIGMTDAGVTLDDGAAALVENVIAADCRRGLYVKDGDMEAHHLTLVDNAAALELLSPSTLSLADSIIAGSPGSVTLVSPGASLEVHHTLFPTGSVPPPGEGNLAGDPEFLDPTAHGYHLRPSSPAAAAASDGGPAGARPVAESAVPGLRLR